MMHLNSLRDSKSPNPQWRTNEKGTRIIIVPPFVNIHFVSLLLYIVLYVDITSSCYISHAYALFYLTCLYIYITCVSLRIISHMLIPLHYLYIAPHAYLHIISPCVLSL